MHLVYYYGASCCCLPNSTQQSPDLTPESSLERDAEKAKLGWWLEIAEMGGWGSTLGRRDKGVLSQT